MTDDGFKKEGGEGGGEGDGEGLTALWWRMYIYRERHHVASHRIIPWKSHAGTRFVAAERKE